MYQRLQKLISAAGVASRRAAEEMIRQGRVTVNGRICAVGDGADPEQDEILLDGVPLCLQQERVFILLHKPAGVVTTMSDEKGRKDVSMLTADVGVRVYPVGRLDLNSEGLLLMTNDGAAANRLMHPSHEVEKVYRTWVRGEHAAEKAQRLRRPVETDIGRMGPAQVRVCSDSGSEALLELRIHEGKNRQIRRMCAAVGLEVTRLLRVAEGEIRLGELPAGKWRRLTAEELRYIDGLAAGDGPAHT